MTRNLNWAALAEELSLLTHTNFEPAQVDVVVAGESLEVLPCGINDGRAFHHMNEVVDFCRCKQLKCYATHKTLDGNIVTYIRIFY